MTRTALRRWAWIHEWSSLVCTLFLFLLCLTGLPLVFREEIAELLSDDPPFPEMPADAPMANLDSIVRAARERHPELVVNHVVVDDDEPKIVVGMLTSLLANPKSMRWLQFDARTGALRKDVEPLAERGPDFLEIMLRLHKDLYAGLPGELFYGVMGLLFAAAIVSGVAIYAPFARKTGFGGVRHTRGSRLRWLDLHNLLGVVTVTWAFVVGVTGIVNDLTQPMALLWQRTDLRAVIEPYKGQKTPDSRDLSSAQAAFDTAKQALPDMTAVSVVFPGARFGTPFHYLVWTRGRSVLTSRLYSPVLVDARTGAIDQIVTMPWYLWLLQVSRPLHFGDYGGLPLKIIWALLDVVTLVVLGSGLYLWLSRHRSPIETRLKELEMAE